MELEEDEAYGANSELRYITLELMKLAMKRNVPFEEMAREYVGNTFCLRKAIEEKESPEKALKAKTESVTYE